MSTIRNAWQETRLNLVNAIVSCRSLPHSRQVHELRTATRSMEALLQWITEAHPRAHTLTEPAAEALEQLKQIRRYAGSLRDLDVHRNLLKRLAEALPDDAKSQEISGEVEALRTQLKKRRRKNTSNLKKLLKDAELDLARNLEAIEQSLDRLSSPTPEPITTAKRWARQARPPGAAIRVDQLHTLRKRTKAARYLAETQKNAPAAVKLAEQLHNLQDAIGQWHDYDLLTQEAEASSGKHSLLTEALKTRRDEALQAAFNSLNQKS